MSLPQGGCLQGQEGKQRWGTWDNNLWTSLLCQEEVAPATNSRKTIQLSPQGSPENHSLMEKGQGTDHGNGSVGNMA